MVSLIDRPGMHSSMDYPTFRQRLRDLRQYAPATPLLVLSLALVYLVVEAPKPYGVFVSGVFLGLTGTKVELDCGIKFVRLGVAPEGGVQKSSQVVWTSEGKSANVVCKSVTRVSITPTR